MTHPAVEDRIAFISSWIETTKKNSKPFPLVNPEEFDRVHTRVETRYGDEQTVLSKLEAEVERNPQDPLAHYRYGLILARVGKRQEAVGQLRIALTKRAFDPYILKDLGWVYFLDGKYQQAFKTLESARAMIPEDPECLFYLGRTQMELGNLADASDRFLKLTRQFPQFTPAYYFLGQSLGKQQQLGDAHYYLGVFYLRKRNFKSATIQLKQALKHIQDDEKRKQIQDWLGKLDPKGSKDKSQQGG
jgi:predicted Zn-dependent protease